MVEASKKKKKQTNKQTKKKKKKERKKKEFMKRGQMKKVFLLRMIPLLESLGCVFSAPLGLWYTPRGVRCLSASKGTTEQKATILKIQEVKRK
jgi:hypothetical protein